MARPRYLAAMALPLLVMTVVAQTVVVQGTVSTMASPVRFASVSFAETDHPANIFSAETDSSGRYQLEITLTSVPSVRMPPTAFELAQNYPNPFSSATVIPYTLHKQSDITVTIYDILGRVVRQNITLGQTVGAHSVLWDGLNAGGHKVASGTYVYSVQAGGESRAGKMMFQGGHQQEISLPPGFLVPEAAYPAPMHRQQNATSYTVIIQNGVQTLPSIVTSQIDNIVIQGDTTLDFSVVREIPIPVSTIFIDSVQQTIRGFGGANIIPWRPEMTADQMSTAFGAGPGQLGFTIFRLRIPYTDDVNEFIPQARVAQLAHSLGAIVFASPWTPPPAMKSNNNIVGGVLNDTSYAAYATHLKTFAEYMATAGVPLYAVSVQNEPDASVTYESCSWNAVQMRAFMKNNAIHIGTRVMMPESQNFVRALSDSTLNDSSAAANVGIIAGHIYGGGLGPYPLAVSKGKEIWMSEHLSLDTTWSGVLATAREMHDCMSAGWNAYVWWYIVRFYGPIGEDGIVTKRGYVMSQYARFIRPGYVRVACHASPQRNVWVSSYKDPISSHVVITVLNTGSDPVLQTFTVTKGTMSLFTPYATTISRNCEQGAAISTENGSFTVTLEASSITTYVSN
jgi:glucuronoarabinoxylan endo-1,4-beta-xylanase